MQDFPPENKKEHFKIFLKVIFAITEKIWDSANNEKWEHNRN